MRKETKTFTQSMEHSLNNNLQEEESEWPVSWRNKKIAIAGHFPKIRKHVPSNEPIENPIKIGKGIWDTTSFIRMDKINYTPVDEMPYLCALFMTELPRNRKIKFKSKYRQKKYEHYEAFSQINKTVIEEFLKENRGKERKLFDTYDPVQKKAAYLYYASLGFPKKELPWIIDIVGRKRIAHRSYKKVIAHLKSFEDYK